MREIKGLALIGALSGIPISTLLVPFIGFKNWLPLCLVLSVTFMVLFLLHFKRLKKGRPDGEVYQLLYLFLERLGLSKTYLRKPAAQMTIGKPRKYHVAIDH